MGSKIGGTAVDTNAPPEPKTSGASTSAPQPMTPPAPKTPFNPNTIGFKSNSNIDTVEYEILTQYDAVKEYGEIIILGKATHFDETQVITFAKLNAGNAAQYRLALPNGNYTPLVTEIGGYGKGKLSKNADGTWTYESKYNFKYFGPNKNQPPAPLTDDEKKIQKAKKELDDKVEAAELKKWLSEN
jgi:hypothetical protein